MATFEETAEWAENYKPLEITVLNAPKVFFIAAGVIVVLLIMWWLALVFSAKGENEEEDEYEYVYEDEQ